MSDSLTESGKKFNINALVLKLIAAAAMLCDHMAVAFFESNFLMRAAGRMAFPIFAFFIAEGYRHTRDVKKYAARLFAFSLIAQVPYVLAFGRAAYQPNVIFTLFLGLMAIWAYDKKEGVLKWVVPFTAAVLAEVVQSDHGSFGIFMVLIFFTVKPLNRKLLAAGALIMFVAVLYAVQSGGVNRYAFIYLFYLLPLGFLYFYNGKKGPGRKLANWFFYIFYPLHLLIIWIIKTVLSN